MHGKTREDRVKTVFGGGGHVVILGAGASIASTLRTPELNGKTLPSMDNFIKIVGLNDIVEQLPEELRATNFETLYSKMHENGEHAVLLAEIESRVQDYFNDMQLPEVPTIYDYLVLSLRSRDCIATFNWDPFLYQAWCRNRHVGDPPYIAFLHGNTAMGYSAQDKRCGPAGMYSKATRNYFEPTRLLYPVAKKDYNEDEFIKSQWAMVENFLADDRVARVSIFGYGAPETDVEAVQLLNKAWGTGDKRVYEQFEIIDIKSEENVVATWKNFIHSHHYDYATDYFDSSLARNPRRTFESYHQHNFPNSPAEAFSASNPVPSDLKTLQELWDWHRELIVAEEEYKGSLKK